MAAQQRRPAAPRRTLPRLPPEPSAADLAAWLRAKSRIDPDTGCHVWTAYANPIHGNAYPVGYIAGKRVTPRRLAYQTHIGPVGPHDRLVMHCGNDRCINHKHIDRLSFRGIVARTWHTTRAAENIDNRETCIRGHQWADHLGTTTRNGQRTHRYCLACKHLRALARTRASQHTAADRLTAAVQHAVSHTLPADLRNEVIQDLTVIALQKRLTPGALAQEAKRITSEVFRQFANRYGPLSLEQETHDGRRLGEVIGAS